MWSRIGARLRHPALAVVAALIALGALAAVSLGTFGSTTDLRMAVAPGTSVGAGVSDVAVGQPVTLGSIMLCVSRPGTAILRSVAVHSATGDIEVQAFAVRLNPFVRGMDGLGDERSTIAGLHLDFDPDAAVKSVSGVCPLDVASTPENISAQLVELAVQVVRHSGDAAGGPALDVTYSVDRSTRTAVIPFGVWLCATTCPPEASALYRP